VSIAVSIGTIKKFMVSMNRRFDFERAPFSKTPVMESIESSRRKGFLLEPGANRVSFMIVTTTRFAKIAFKKTLIGINDEPTIFEDFDKQGTDASRNYDIIAHGMMEVLFINTNGFSTCKTETMKN
jgi:hypothetical protein